MFDLEDKTAIVTGAATGIGEGIARLFARAKAHVIIADLNGTAAQAVAESISGSGGSAEFAEVDVSDRRACQSLVSGIRQRRDHIDVLVNNAGIGAVGTILDAEEEELDRLWSVNVKGMFYLIKAVLPGMIERRAGSIVNIASALGVTAMADRFSYTTTKHAVVGLTRSIAYDFGETGVRVNCICPGRVETDFVRARLAEYDEPEVYRRQMEAQQAQNRMGTPEEIASAALYLASEASSFVTGTAMMVDGGYSCGK